VKPDGVVLELDPERVVRLTKQYAGFDQNGSNTGQLTTDELIYGVDFASAIETSQKLDIPLFLGDEYAQETKSRLIRDALNVKKYSPRPLLNSVASRIKSKEDNADCVRIDILRMFAADPNKLRPLLIAGFPPFLFAVLAFFFDNGTTQGGSLIVLEIVVSIVVSCLAVSFLFNTVIVERDEILAASTLQASEVLRSLKDNKSIRKKWSFTVKKKHEDNIEDTTLDNKESLPLFTLKTPLITNGIRKLNLFEPRWLKMMDEVTQGTITSIDERVFGCVRCTNKFYSAISINGEEGRYADIIFEKQGTYATIKELKEGLRPSGDRRINVKIEGGDAFIVDENNLSVSKDGYMVAKQVEPTVVDSDDYDDTPSTIREEGRESSIRIVVVVGLLHANGIVDLIHNK